MHLQLRTFRLQYSTVGICAAIVDITTIQWALYCILGAKYRAHPPVYTMWTVVPEIYAAFTAPHIQSSIFIWTYLRCYWRYLDYSMRVVLQTLSQIQRVSSRLRYVNCGPGHIQGIYCSAYSVFNIPLKVGPMLLEVSRQYNERYTASSAPITAHILQLSLCELWSRTYTKYLQLLIVRPQYSTERTCVALRDIPILRCALYCKFGAKYSAHPSVYAMWTVVPAIYKVFAAPDSQATIFNWTYLRCT
jgi:hypothetical protein